MAGFGILGQRIPAAGSVAEILATITATGGAVLTYLSFANKSASTADSLKWAIVPDGDTLADNHYQDFVIPVPANSSFKMSISVPIGFNGKIYVASANGSTSVTAGGMEYTA